MSQDMPLLLSEKGLSLETEHQVAAHSGLTNIHYESHSICLKTIIFSAYCTVDEQHIMDG